MDHRFTEADLPLLNTAIRYFPDPLSTLLVIKHVADRAEFPIMSFDHLVEIVGGEQEPLPFLAAPYPIGQFRHAIPAHYFPITTQEDLLAKVARLREMAPPASGGPQSDW